MAFTLSVLFLKSIARFNRLFSLVNHFHLTLIVLIFFVFRYSVVAIGTNNAEYPVTVNFNLSQPTCWLPYKITAFKALNPAKPLRLQLYLFRTPEKDLSRTLPYKTLLELKTEKAKLILGFQRHFFRKTEICFVFEATWLC